MTKPTYVLGTGLSHDGSACLLKDGEVCVAIEKERLTRIKHDGYADNEALQYCLDAEGIRWGDVAVLVQNANFSNFDRGNAHFHGVPRIVPESVRVETISHHQAHAYSVVGTAPFDEMAILVVDGCGSSYDDTLDLEGATIPEPPPDPEAHHLYFEKDSYYLYRGGKLRPVYKDFSPFGWFLKGYSLSPPTTKHSIGGLYSAVSQYVFQGMEDPGKLMGLAPYGKPGVYDIEAFQLRDGRVFVDYGWMDRFTRPRTEYKQLEEHFQYYADIAYWIQREIERALLYVLEHRHRLAPERRLGYAGGVALNAVANARLLRESKFEELYMQPAAADNGLAIGCAYYGWLEVLGRERVLHSGSPYYGRSYAAEETTRALEAVADRVTHRVPEDLLGEVVERLQAGQVLAWYEGGSEFGPRALGHRSILADPRDATVRDRINRTIKFREDFRPFAPSVLAEAVHTYFECEEGYQSPYMILVAPCRPEHRERLAAVVHEDGSSRVHTVTEEASPTYHRLLRRYGEATGVPVLLNTSLNKRGMPIVETPEHALDFFLEAGLDALVLDGHLVEKRPGVEAAAAADPDAEFQRGLGALYPEDMGIR